MYLHSERAARDVAPRALGVAPRAVAGGAASWFAMVSFFSFEFVAMNVSADAACEGFK